MIIAGALLFGGKHEPTAKDGGVRTAILPFDTRGTDSIGRIIAERVSSDITREGTLRLVSVRGTNDAGVDTAAMRAVAKRAGARYALKGYVDADSGRVRVNLVLVDTVEGGPRVRAATEGDVDQIDEMAEDLAFQIAASRPGSGRRLDPEFPRNVSSRAIELYTQAQADRDAGRFVQARSEFRRSIEADTNFGLAYYHLSRVANWTGEYELARWAIDGAMRHRDSLVLSDQFRIDAWDAFQSGEPVKARRFIDAALVYVTDSDALYTLGEILFHWGSQLGWPMEQANRAFERALAVQPTNVDALVHRARLAAVNDPARLDSLVVQSERRPLDAEQALELQALRAFTDGTAADRDAVLRRAAALDDKQLVALATTVSAYAPRADRAQLVALLRTPQRAITYRVAAAILRAEIAMGNGRWSEAMARLDSASDLPAARTDEYRAMLSTLPFVQRPAAELAALRDRLAAQKPSQELGPSMQSIAANGVFPPRYYYLLALLSIRANDSASVGRYLGELDAHARAPDPNIEYHAMMARIVRAEWLRAQGKNAEALSALGAAQVLPSRVLASLPDYPQAHERFLRAELLHAVGRDREALRWYAAFPDPNADDVVYLAPSLMRRAEIEDALGQTSAARADRASATARWRDADASVAAYASRR